ncbi:uncharacterized protein LOC130723339 [Lotus japonicus]|uniref:uncharacterized protein LOC130723339 n=1 Tax=Lotus japonicus TaxID=34305 RepID=UPI00258842D7|nr:uncharacterized protein LOC130723339 [Lotus japonicus]
MLSHLVCGNFHNEEEDGPAPPCSSPVKSKRKENRDKNPFSSRGLDKFSELLEDLDQKRQKVYSRMNPHDISFVRFAYTSSNDFVPIVVKVKNRDHKKQGNEEFKVRHLTSFSESMEKTAAAAVEERKQQHPKLESEKKETKKSGFSFSLRKPSFYVPAMMILILVFLALFGRSVATLCTCVVWYVVPMLKDSSLKPRKSILKKKEYVRGLSEKKMVTVTEGLHSPRSGDSRASNDKSSGKHSHQKSW